MLQNPPIDRSTADQTSAPLMVPSVSHRSRPGGGGPMSSRPSTHAAVEFIATSVTSVLTSCPNRNSNRRTTRGGAMDTRTVVQTYYDRAWRDGDVDAIDDLLAEDHVDETPPPGFDGTREAQKQIAGMMR